MFCDQHGVFSVRWFQVLRRLVPLVNLGKHWVCQVCKKHFYAYWVIALRLDFINGVKGLSEAEFFSEFFKSEVLRGVH
jgi:hypothetical protein